VVVRPNFPPTSGSPVRVRDPLRDYERQPYQVGGGGAGSIADDPDDIQADLEAFRRIREKYGGGGRTS